MLTWLLNKLIDQNLNKTFNELNFRIKNDEIIKAVQKLSYKKACGIDGILNEMLKSGCTILVPLLNKLFNRILTSGIFPNSWRTNTLTHKKGEKLNPDNYRGIAVGSNLCKLFCSVLHNRINLFADSNAVIPACQIGYKKKSRTSDHILTLKNLIDKYLRKAKNKCSHLYTCFIDFKSAFDTVWRNALMYKLLRCGIGGNILQIIKNMYSEVYYCVKTQKGLSNKFISSVGVKQGCVLSPTLFNIFLSDLPDIFDQTCEPVNIFDKDINCLMFADDIVLLSESPTGLQKSQDYLDTYCKKWNLTININKQKLLFLTLVGVFSQNFN